MVTKMTATASSQGNGTSGYSTESTHEIQSIATPITSIVAETRDDKAHPEKRKQEVCTSCKHLYNSSEVVLTPVTLCQTHKETDGETTSKDTQALQPMVKPKTWKARRYDGLCSCIEAGQVCNCDAPNQHPIKQFLQISAGTLWGPRIKRTVLVIAAIIPFIFLIAYLIMTYK